MVHLCLSDRPSQLLRWQQAFPDGMIFGSVPEVGRRASGAATLWLHADAFPGVLLPATLAELRKGMPDVPVVILSCIPTPAEATNLFKCGISGYCHAMATPAMLQQVAVVVENGGMWLGPDLMKALINVLSPGMAEPSLDVSAEILQKLTPREREVALQVAGGASNKEIASSLQITERTVKAHLGMIFEKLGVRDRLQLALLVFGENENTTLCVSL